MWHYIILGVLQGIFEWIPVSSEGIVALSSQFLSVGSSPVNTAIFLHFGTLLASLVYFRKDWIEILTFKNPVLLRFLIISTVVSLAIGFPLYSMIESEATGGVLLLIMGGGLLFTAFFNRTKKFKFQMDEKSKVLPVIGGLLQGLAVIPGLSRSGATVFGLSLGQLSPPQILRISYLMSAPVVFASSIYLLLTDPVLVEGWPALISSFLVGIACLAIIMKYVSRINFFYFALIFALLCIIGGIIVFFI
jgi:undecaprenyl-diphosphatase